MTKGNKMKRVISLILFLVFIESGVAGAHAFGLSQVGSIVKRKLQAYGGASAYGFDTASTLRHEIVGIYDIYTPQDGKKLVITSTVPTKNHECHACAAKISFFIIGASDGAWHIEKSYINAHHMGEWGSAPAKEEYQVIRLNDHTMGLFLDVFWATQGYSGNRIVLYAFGADSVKEIFNQEVALENGATGNPVRTDWKAKFRFVRGSSPFYDIVLEKKGIIEDEAVNQKLHYVYDGSKYALQKNTKEPSAKKRPQQRRKKFISKKVKGSYRAIVTAGKGYFDFDLSGYGDSVGLRVDKHTLDSLHMLAMDVCKRDADGGLIACDGGVSNPSLDYRFDGSSFDMTVVYDWRGKRQKTEIYNDEAYIYWADFTDGRVKSLDKFRIERVE